MWQATKMSEHHSRIQETVDVVVEECCCISQSISVAISTAACFLASPVCKLPLPV
jgi:hypothetical protein